ncbi:hypothetical protein BDD12DRAFT_809786 [Trichophaea hybrida]|nr:hypothetical protein BDD12DRAFT_809786 [Trichophaea hybrida]
MTSVDGDYKARSRTEVLRFADPSESRQHPEGRGKCVSPAPQPTAREDSPMSPLEQLRRQGIQQPESMSKIQPTCIGSVGGIRKVERRLRLDEYLQRLHRPSPRRIVNRPNEGIYMTTMAWRQMWSVMIDSDPG